MCRSLPFDTSLLVRCERRAHDLTWSTVFVSVDGLIIDASVATVAIDDHSLVVGNGAFETLKIVDGTPFAVSRHLARLERNLCALSIASPGAYKMRSAIESTVAGSELSQGRLRLTITAGSGSLGSSAPTGPPRMIVAVTPLGEPAAPSAITVGWCRNERGALAGLKTTSYGENVLMLGKAHAVGAGEAIMANTRGLLCEGTGTNVFVVRRGVAHTPSLSSGCLAGITRALVIDACRENNIAVLESELGMSALFDSEEVFLTSSMRDVQGLEKIDDHLLAVGPITNKIGAAFATAVRKCLDP